MLSQRNPSICKLLLLLRSQGQRKYDSLLARSSRLAVLVDGSDILPKKTTSLPLGYYSFSVESALLRNRSAYASQIILSRSRAYIGDRRAEYASPSAVAIQNRIRGLDSQALSASAGM